MPKQIAIIKETFLLQQELIKLLTNCRGIMVMIVTTVLMRVISKVPAIAVKKKKLNQVKPKSKKERGSITREYRKGGTTRRNVFADIRLQRALRAHSLEVHFRIPSRAISSLLASMKILT